MAGDEDLDDAELKAAIAASLEDLQGSRNESDPTPSGRQKGVADLTAGSDDEVVEVYPKSKSVVESESEGEGGEGGEDAELKRAVEASLRASEGNDSDDDAELKRAIHMSLQGEFGDGDNASAHASLARKENDKTASSFEQEKFMSKPEPPRTMPLLGLDRKQMEQERLARLAKRKAEDAPMNQPDTKQLRTKALSGGQGAKGLPMSPLRAGSPRKESSASSSGLSKSIPDNLSTIPSVQFPKGVVKKTWNKHCPRNGDDIKIEEVFQAADLELAVLSSFMWDMEWIFSNMNTRSTRFLLIMQAKEESTVCYDPYQGELN